MMRIQWDDLSTRLKERVRQIQQFEPAPILPHGYAAYDYELIALGWLVWTNESRNDAVSLSGAARDSLHRINRDK